MGFPLSFKPALKTMKPSFFKIIIYSVLLTPVFSNAQIIESDFGSSKNVDLFGPEEIEKPTTANHFTLPKDTIIYSTRILFDNNQSVWQIGRAHV